MIFFPFAFLIVGVLGLEISGAGTLNFDLEFGTTANSVYLTSQPGHWLHTLTASQPTNSVVLSHNPSAPQTVGSTTSNLISLPTEQSIYTVTETISQISFVTLTTRLCTPFRNLSTPAPLLGTGSVPVHSLCCPTSTFQILQHRHPTTPSADNQIQLTEGWPNFYQDKYATNLTVLGVKWFSEKWYG
ncbi:hypothetical protein F5Y17DRAFT_453257 [Xylariaceae sp. FL0594]|nr:hypothetical protein F5Y17DRAFT_453257 [Xylariaceae sp. FL0594]